MNRGVFISFEGSEGCGKSTQIARLESRLTGQGMKVIRTREPGGTILGERIRDLLQHTPEVGNMTPESELFLFAASRAQLVHNVIRPALAAGKWVIADRHDLSSRAYQGGGRQLGDSKLQPLKQLVLGDFAPDLTLLLDLDPEIGLERARARG